MQQGAFLSNTHNPNDNNARMYFHFSYEAYLDPHKADMEWQNHLNWIEKNIIGRPQASDIYSTEELEKMGMVGIYAPAP